MGGQRRCAKVQTVKASVGETKSGSGTGKRKCLPGLTVKDGLTQHPFDLANGVRTSGLVAGRHLKTGHRNDRHATAYFGVAPSVFRALIRKWRSSGPAAAIGETTFIDLGAGMGRAVLLASELGFKTGRRSRTASTAGQDRAQERPGVAQGGQGTGANARRGGRCRRVRTSRGAGAGVSVQSVRGSGPEPPLEGVAQGCGGTVARARSAVREQRAGARA